MYCDNILLVAAKESGNIKSQGRWATTDRGRNLYTFRPNMGHKINHSFVSTVGGSIFSNLKTQFGLHNSLMADWSNTQSSNKKLPVVSGSQTSRGHIWGIL